MVNPTPQGNVVRFQSTVEVIAVSDMPRHGSRIRRLLLAHQQQLLNAVWLEGHHTNTPVPVADAWLYAWLGRREGDDKAWVLYRYVLLKPGTTA